MHQHHPGHQHQRHEMERRQNAQLGTVVEYVYRTAAKTFDGPIGGYITAPATPDTTSSDSNSDNNENDDNDAAVVSPTPTPSSSPSPSPTSTPTPSPTPAQLQAEDINTDTTSTSSTPTSTSISTSTSSTSSSSITSSTPEKAAALQTLSASSSSPSSLSPSSTSSFIQSTSSSAQSTSTAESNSSSTGGGMSGGAKAGLAIGIILVVALLLGLLFFCFRHRRKQANEDYVKADDEKAAYMEGLKRSQSVTSTRTTATAPRLSLRPITEFMPDMAARGKATSSATPAAASGAVGGAVVGAAASKDTNDPENPFGNHAEVSRKSQAPSEKEIGLPIQNNAAENPFGTNAEILPQTDDLATLSMPDNAVPAPLRVRTPTPEASSIAGGAAVAGAAGGLAAAKFAARHNAPKPLHLVSKGSISPAASSPAVSEFSQTSVAPAAMVNGPPPSNVHRIQLDFKPSMDDELGLRAGQLVRLLHEYDDGWALCIRLDRSQQGVAPRTCLSARPVKPRPPPGARAPGPRGPPPGMMGPNQQRPQSPAGGRNSPNPRGQARAPRPLNHVGSQQRSMSPGPYGGGPQRPAKIPTPGSKRRSNSTGEISNRRNSPPGPSGLNPNVQRVPMQLQAVTSPEQALSQSPPQSMVPRKPVPGQAM